MENNTKNELLTHLPYNMEVLDSRNLKVPVELYQRGKKASKVKRIIDEFDERIANEPKVSFRAGRYRVFDGQHTVAARVLMSREDSIPIVCKVYYGLSEEDEAHLFAMQTGASSKPKSGEIFKAELCAKNEVANSIFSATEKTGTHISLSNAHGYDRIACVKCAEKEYARLGKEKYMEAISIIREAWCGAPKSFYTEIVIGVCEFVNLYYGEYKRDTLIAKLGNLAPEDIIRAILVDDSIKGIKKNIKQIFSIYNAGLKKPLPIKF